MTTMLIPAVAHQAIEMSDAALSVEAYPVESEWIAYVRATGSAYLIDVQTFANRAEVTEFATRLLNN